MALSRISNGSRVGQLLSYNVCGGCQQMSTKPIPDSSSSTNSKLEEFKSKVEDGPDLGDFIAGVVPRDLHSDYEVASCYLFSYFYSMQCRENLNLIKETNVCGYLRG